MSEYFLQSTEKPLSSNHPTQTKGYMILVESKVCKYGINCTRDCWSVAPYTEGGYCYRKGNHQKTHWHIARNAMWTNGSHFIDFIKR